MAKSSHSIAGRRPEQEILQRIFESPNPELAVVYGRRRVGKTHLIREFFQPKAGTYLEVTGQHDAPMEVQLGHFQREVERVFFDNNRLPRMTTWEEALGLLCDQLEARASARPIDRIVVFLDELPWLATRRSRLLPAIDHSWNTRLTRRCDVPNHDDPGCHHEHHHRAKRDDGVGCVECAILVIRSPPSTVLT